MDYYVRFALMQEICLGHQFIKSYVKFQNKKMIEDVQYAGATKVLGRKECRNVLNVVFWLILTVALEKENFLLHQAILMARQHIRMLKSMLR
mmetsp:Transcript_16131/g.29166  ORF Transcript_16131/g.29166 Transcript_16131/m.29166 type:complete len:92 (+) Transcript_16131:718-993(+)